MKLGSATHLEINGIDLTSCLAGPVTFEYDTTLLEALPDATLTLDGYWDTGLTDAELNFTVPFCGLTAQSRCFWLRLFDPQKYARLRRLRYETRRRRKRGG